MLPYILDNLVKVSAFVVHIEIQQNSCLAMLCNLCEDWRDISVAHKTQAQRLDTVVYVHTPRYRVCQVPWIDIAPRLVELLQRPSCLPYQILEDKTGQEKVSLYDESRVGLGQAVMDLQDSVADGIPLTRRHMSVV